MPVPPPPPRPSVVPGNASASTAKTAGGLDLDKDGNPIYFSKDPLILQAGQPAADLMDPDAIVFRIVAPASQERDQQADPGLISLFGLLKALIPGLPLSRQIPPKTLYHNLGRLRGTRLTLDDYNAQLVVTSAAQQNNQDDDDPIKRYTRHHAVDLFAVLGFSVPSPSTRVHVPGLDQLIHAVEQLYAGAIASHRAAIAAGSVEFEGLGELYAPGAMVAARTDLAGSTLAGFRVRASWFEEKRTLFRLETSFHIRLEALVPFGKYLALVSFEQVYSGWTGDKVRALADLGVAVPLRTGSSDTDRLAARGHHCLTMLSAGTRANPCPFVQYATGAFFVHRQANTTATPRTSLAPSATHGRMVIDPERGLLLGHFPAQGADEATQAILTAAGRYKRLLGTNDLAKGRLPPVGDGSLLLFPATPEGTPAAFHAIIWPAVVGFSLPVKAWGHVLVDALSPIQFNDAAFDQLVLAPERKRLIRALVKFGGGGGKYQFQDLIQGKSGGSVFLLHGPPGVGKTLTAEAIAEMLHRPLYYVTMGELGTNPEQMEARMGQVLDLCAGWNALVLIDEADVFLEKRTVAHGDVTRNAMVCVMLKMLEYHEGILFLTTNRVAEFDPAIESRITVALRYDPLDVAARAKVWENLMRLITGGIEVDKDLDFVQLAKEKVMNGRQIKNAVRLALSLAEEAGETKMTMALVRQTMAITAIGREEMSDKNTYSL